MMRLVHWLIGCPWWSLVWEHDEQGQPTGCQVCEQCGRRQH